MPSALVRRLGRVAAGVGTSLLVLVVAVVALLQVPAIATWAANRVLGLVPLSPGYALEVGGVTGNWLTDLNLVDLSLRRGSRELAHLDRVEIDYDLPELRGPDRRLDRLVVDGGRVVARRTREGWDIAGAFQTSGDTSGGGGDLIVDRLAISRLDIAAHLAPDSVARAEDLALRGRDLVVGDTVLLTMDSLGAEIAPPGEPALWFSLVAAGAATPEVFRLDPLRISSHRSDIAGRAVVPRSFDDPQMAERLDVRLEARPLALADLASIYPDVPPEGELQLDVGASARGRLVTAQLAARLDQATIELEGGTVLGRGAPAVYQVSGEVRELDPSRLHRAAPIGRLTGEIEADLRGETLTLADGSASVRLRNSRIGETDLRGLDLQADVKQGRADLRVRGRVFGGTVRVAGWARPFDSVPSYRLAGGAVGLEGTERVAGALAGDSGAPVLDLRFRIAGNGIAPREADVEGKLELTAVRQGGERIDLGEAAVSLDQGRLELRPHLLVGGGTVRGVATARLGDTVTYEVREGRIDGVDLGRLLGDTVVAPLTGRFSLAGEGLAPAEATANATLQLEELRYAARRVERVIARARVADGRAVLDLRGLLQGGRLAVEATTRPFDSVTTFEIRRASLDSVDLGTLLGRPDLAGPVSLAGSGGGRWGEAVKAVEATFTVEPSRLGTIQVTSGEADAEMRGERLTWTAGLRTSGGSISLSGVGRPLAEVPAYEVREGRADSIDLGVLLGRDSLTTDLDARFTGSLTGSGLDRMLARLDVELLPSSVNQAELGPGRLTLGLDRGTLGGTLRLQGGDAVVAADLTGEVGGDQSRLRAEGDVRVERLARWTGEPAADGRLEGRFGLDLVADSGGLVTAGGSVTAIGGVGEVRLQQLHVALRPTPGMIHVDTLVVRSNAVTLDGGGGIAMRPGGSGPGTATFRVTGRTGDVTPLALLAGADSVVLDSTLLDLTLTGPPERRKIEGTADVFRLLYAGTLAERVTARGAGIIDSGGMGAIAGRLQVEGAAAGEVSVRRIDVTGRYDSLLALEGTVTVSDDIGVALALRGTTNGDTTRAELRRLEVAEGGRTWRLQRPSRVVLRPRVVEVDGFTLGAGDRHLSVDGTLDRRDTSDMTMRVEGLDLDALAQARLVPVAGTLDGTLRLSGPATAPSVDGKLSLDLRRSGGEDVGRIESEVAWSRTGLRIDAVASHGGGGRLTVAGTLPWRFTLVPEDTAATVGLARAPVDTMSLAVRADSFDLAVFEPFLPEEAAQELTGGLAVDAHIGGTPDQPRATGTVDVRRLGLTLPTLGVAYSEGRLAGRLSGERLTIDTLRLTTGDDEELLASGVVVLEPITDPTLSISARLEEFVVSDSDELRAVATGEVQLAGTAAKPVLTGDLRLEEAEIFTGGETAAAVEEVELTPADLQQLAQHFGPSALDAADEGAGFLERFRMNIDLSFARRVWFRKAESPSIDIELSGRINLRQTPGEEMQFFGQVEPIPRRGELNLYGRSFEVVEGTITLRGPVEEIALDVTAQYRVPTEGDPDDEDVIISVQATGNPDSLDLDFSAEPSMPQEDMISYIVTGNPASDNLLADQQGGGVNATDLALNELAENLGGAAGEELGFDVFTIRQEPERGLTLTAGRYITSRVFVSLQQPLCIGVTSDEHLTGATGPGFELEYAWRRWLRSTLRGGSLPTSLLMRGRYAF